MAKQKYYVIWAGATPGIYTSWPEAERQVKGFAGARYKSFMTKEEAETAYHQGAGAKPAARKPAAAKSARAVSTAPAAEVNIYC
ncbi:MAG TPA: RNase H1/viroplasmin domain-containing protein, partial [Kineobactrum sp.]